MSYFEFPHTRTYDGDLGWLIKKVEQLNTAYNNFFDLNTITFHDPIEWTITTEYKANVIVYDGQSSAFYISRAPVPSGIDISNSDYWVLITPFKTDTALSSASYNPVANYVITSKFNSVDNNINDNAAKIANNTNHINTNASNISTNTNNINATQFVFFLKNTLNTDFQ